MPQPQFRLQIYDRKTHYVLWTLTQPVEYAVMQGSHDRNFDNAILQLADNFEALGEGHPAPAAGSTP